MANAKQQENIRQKIDEYNQNPNLCKFCNQPIIAPYGKKLKETKVKKFCSKSCASSFNNKAVVHNRQGGQCFIEKCSDEELVEAFNNSKTLIEFSKKIGYKRRINTSNPKIANRLQKLNLDVDELKVEIDILSLTKKQLFDRYEAWQTARSTIAQIARQVFKDSDKPKKCAICGYDKHYEVAHIVAVSDFDDDALVSEINDIDNLIALCPNHHWEYDNGILDISDI